MEINPNFKVNPQDVPWTSTVLTICRLPLLALLLLLGSIIGWFVLPVRTSYTSCVEPNSSQSDVTRNAQRMLTEPL